ncbi:MAG: TMEM165/GDT1 family protein [Pseudomonadales bacterium]|nr:TMEM165/GDT1 family protein [Pseudomonadales bacterium]
MDVLLVSTLSVAVAEIGDKTQLLSLVLVARYRRPGVIALGILVATLANHAGAAWFGMLVAELFSEAVLRWVLTGSFLAMALWLLVPDAAEEEEMLPGAGARSAFVGSLVLFFLAEMADKTQVATIVLGARYEDDLAMVVCGTTLGMMMANLPVLYGGHALLKRVPLRIVRTIASALFLVLAVLTFTALA